MRIIAAVIAVILTASVQSAVSSIWDTYTYYYTHYTNASTQLSLVLSPGQVVYWDGSSVNLHIGGGGFMAPRASGASAANLFINCLIDGTNVANTSFLWGTPYVPNQGDTLIPVRGLPVGTHTVTVQHTNTYEYFNETIFRYSNYTYSWGTYHYYYYYDVYHYYATPTSASRTMTVLPSPNFHRLQASAAPDTVTFSYAGIPESNYWFYFSFDLIDWHLHSSGKAGTNGLVEFYDGTDTGNRFYRVYGP